MPNQEKRVPVVKASPAPTSLCIGGIEIEPGQRRTVNLPLARLYTYADMHMPVHVIRGRRSGPTLFVSAAVHGDELIGVEIIRRLLQMKLVHRLRGSLIAVPIVNSYGLINHERYLPDRRDLNRSFPGSATGSLTAQVAYMFMQEIVANSTHGIDLHTGSNHRANLPQIRANLNDAETERLARIFNAPIIIDANLRDGSMRAAALDKGVPVLLYEAGEALRYDEIAIRVGLRGVLNVMRAIGLLAKPRTKLSVAPPIVAHTTKWIRAPKSGFMHSSVRLGAAVKHGAPLCVVSDPTGENAQTLASTVSGIVIGRRELPLIYRGDALFHIASLDAQAQSDSALENVDMELDWDLEELNPEDR